MPDDPRRRVMRPEAANARDVHAPAPGRDRAGPQAFP